jgi:pilus assembly protein CpaC
VLEDGIINLRIEPEVSQIDPTTAVKTASVAVPGIIVRRASTVIELRDGQSFAIAGLLQSYTSEQQQQLPWLGDIPVIGALFRSAAFERRETDLAIIVTPRLVKPARPGQRLQTPFDATARANDAEFFLAGRQEVPVAAARGSTVVPVSGHILDLRQGGTRAR